jgi:hypothetical protein
MVMAGCQPGTGSFGPAPALPGSSVAALGPYRGVNRAEVEGDLRAQFERLGGGRDSLELRAEYAAATEVAATTLADWARRLLPEIQATGATGRSSSAHVVVLPPAQSSAAIDVSWGPVWGVTITSVARRLEPADIREWAALLSQLALDERWRLATYSVRRPIRERP